MAAVQKMILRSKIDTDFQIEVDSKVINCCNILKNVTEHTDNSDAVDVDMSKWQLEKFVELHNHFEDPSNLEEKDLEWSNAFFKAMEDQDFKDFFLKAHQCLGSQRFLKSVEDFILFKFENMEVEPNGYQNIFNDYTPEEEKAIRESPLYIFNGITIQEEEAALAADVGGGEEQDVQKNTSYFSTIVNYIWNMFSY